MKKFSSCNSIFVGEWGYELMTVETDISSGLFFFRIIGLADRMVQESRFRILSALRNSEFGIPQRRNEKVTVSLLPAHVKKVSSYSDLAIATAYLIASKQIPCFQKPTILIGQLGLDGDISCAEDLSPMINSAIKNGIYDFISPQGKLDKLHSNRNIRIAQISNLKDITHIDFKTIKFPATTQNATGISKPTRIDKDERIFSIDSLKGIEYHKRALMIAIAGKHPILFGGIPGEGKSALSRCAPELMPDLLPEQAMEVQSIYAHAQIPRPDFYKIPVRTPHHHVSRIGMIGGVQNRHIGEISLAHHGILILDELCEFERGTIESLREVFDQKGANVRRGSRQSFVPFEGLVIATTNLCPCGSTDLSNPKSCRCALAVRRRYQGRLSNPMLDRFHIKTLFYSQNCKDESSITDPSHLSGAIMVELIIKARQRQNTRNGPDGSLSNSHLTMNEIEGFGISKDASDAIIAITEQLSLSRRLITNTIRVARTIADLESSELIEKPHVLEAFQYIKTNPFD